MVDLIPYRIDYLSSQLKQPKLSFFDDSNSEYSMLLD